MDHEEAGEKWRGGDAAKSVRFFGRAIDTYEEGLKKWPQSFDLAYNKYAPLCQPSPMYLTFLLCKDKNMEERDDERMHD